MNPQSEEGCSLKHMLSAGVAEKLEVDSLCARRLSAPHELMFAVR